MKKQLSILSMAFIGCTLLMTSCKKPSASFTADKSAVAVGEAVNFTNTSTDASKVMWDFGDGTQSASAGTSVSHVYQRPGSYTVSLLGTKKNGKKPSDAATVTITVSGVTASFTASNAAPAAYEVVTFTATTAGAEEFDWDFGDGNSILEDNPVQSHAFSTSGTYTVTLTTYGPNHSSVGTKSMVITVGGLNGNNVNWAMLVGKWNYSSKVVKDERNGVAFTNTSSSAGIPSSMYNWTTNASTAFTSEFTSNGEVIMKDMNGNYVGGGGAVSGTYDLLDATRMTSTSIAGTGSYGMGVAIGTYTVSAAAFSLTYVSTSTLPAYTDYSVTPSVPHAAGEKQIVTTTYTFAK